MRLQRNTKADLIVDGPEFWQALGSGLTFVLRSAPENRLQLWEDVELLQAGHSHSWTARLNVSQFRLDQLPGKRPGHQSPRCRCYLLKSFNQRAIGAQQRNAESGIHS